MLIFQQARNLPHNDKTICINWRTNYLKIETSTMKIVEKISVPGGIARGLSPAGGLAYAPIF